MLSIYSTVNVAEQNAWNYYAAPLPLQTEREMEGEAFKKRIS